MDWTKLPSTAQGVTAEAVLKAFARMPIDEALLHLGTSRHGLDVKEVEARRCLKGANILPTHKSPSWMFTLLEAIPNPFNILLVFLAIVQVSLPDRDWAAFTVLLVMVVISVLVRFWQEYRSSVAVFRLQWSVQNDVKVQRQLPINDVDCGKTARVITSRVPESDLVPGDIIMLRPGDVVPADCRLLEASFLRVSQSSWTGENEPVPKAVFAGANKDVSLFDTENVAFMGTNVVSGNGMAVVLRTGPDVLVAGMSAELKKKRERNDFQSGIRNVSWMLIGFMCVMVPIVLGVNGKTTGDWEQAALFSISVAVGLVPEMLPAIVNTNLARGAYKLSQMKAIVKRLDSVQNLGAMTVLCSDKTGTLTKDEITICHWLDYLGADNSSVLKLATIEATVQGTDGNNIDAAIRAYRLADGNTVPIATYVRVAAIPFTFERRRSACIVRGVTGQNLLIVKGAIDEVLCLCSFVDSAGVTVPLDAEKTQILQWRVNSLNQNGYRVLLVAEKQLTRLTFGDEGSLNEVECNMTLKGIISFIDPPKADAAESIAQLKKLGVDVKVLTGDSLPVALNVCQALRLIHTHDSVDDELQAITGPELAQMNDSQAFDETVRSCRVFAKLTPQQKASVIQSLRKQGGHCVGMLGDGINDCMALRSADVGISVDSGASVAKACADLILTEKGLDIIVKSVRTGRITHGNTIKYIKMVASSNFGNVFSVLAASAWLPFQPMLSLQILAQNLLYDISQIGIPWDHVDSDYLRTPKRWNPWDLLRFVLVFGPMSSIIDVLTYLLGWYYYGVQTANDTAGVRMFQAHWFLQGVLTQTLIVHLLRTSKIPFHQSRATTALTILTVAVMVIGSAVPWIPPLQQAFRFGPPAGSYIGFLAAELLLYCIMVQLSKMIYVRIFKTWL